MAGPLRGLARRWEVVPRPVVGGTAEHPAQVDLALLHQGRGIALVDLAPRVTVHAVASLRQVLDAARLDARHPGLLPIAYCRLAPEEAQALPRLLDAAFAAEPPLTVADADWVPTVRGLLAAGLPAPAAGPARATATGRRRSSMTLAAAALLLPAGGSFVVFGLLGAPATPPRGGAVVDATSRHVAAPETPRLSAPAERLRATPGPQLHPSGPRSPPSVAPLPATSASLEVAVPPAAGSLSFPARPPPPSGFRLSALPPPESAAPSSLERTAVPPAKAAAPPPPGTIGPERPRGGRGDDAQLLGLALPPPPPPISDPTARGHRSPPATRITPPPAPRGAAAEVAAAPRQPASPRCAAVLARLQLGESPSHADRSHLHTVCAPRP